LFLEEVRVQLEAPLDAPVTSFPVVLLVSLELALVSVVEAVLSISPEILDFLLKFPLLASFQELVELLDLSVGCATASPSDLFFKLSDLLSFWNLRFRLFFNFDNLVVSSLFTAHAVRRNARGS